MLRTKHVVLGLLIVLANVVTSKATSYVRLELHQRVQSSDTIVVARVLDPQRALVSVERVLKGAPSKQITLVSYIDNFNAPADRKALVLDARELLFLTQKGDAYAPLQEQHGRLAIDGDRLFDSLGRETRSVSQTLASIDRLVTLQTLAARGDAEADAAFVAALGNDDVELQAWALWNAAKRLKAPTPELVDALLARWPEEVGPVCCRWNAAGLVANTVVTWRIERAAPLMARILTTSANGYERGWAAKALGGTGDRTYLSLLRRVAAEDPHPEARALAYNGIMHLLGPESFADLRVGAKDAHEHVRAQAVVHAYNMLELEQPEPRWPRPSDALVVEVRAFLQQMLRDPARLVSENALSMLREMARQRRSN